MGQSVLTPSGASGDLDVLLAASQPGQAAAQPGFVAGPTFGALSTLTLVANQAYLARFVPDAPVTLTKVSFQVTTQDAADPNVSVAIYDALTLARLAVSATAAGSLNTTGVKTVSLVTPVAVGSRRVLYVAISSNTAGVAVIRSGVAGNAALLAVFGATAPNNFALEQAAAHPLPNPIVPVAGGSDFALLFPRTD